jgi:hypothetical protein
VKDSVRKQVLEIMAQRSSEPPIKKLKEEFERKGFLSKRELKILLNPRREVASA